MHRLISACLLAGLIGTSAPALAVKGVVAFIKGGCSYYIVETQMGYALLQWYGGATPARGDTLVGDYESYGMKEIFIVNQDSETRVWVDNYWMSKDRVVELYSEKCS
jgi:hypothetical protein